MDPQAKTQIRETLTIEEVAARLGINRSTAYERARCDQLPVPVIRVGRRYLVSRTAYESVMRAQHESRTTSSDAEANNHERHQP